MSYITSNSFLRVNYGLPLRKFVHESCDIIAMIDIEGSQIFESAIVNTVIAALTTVRSNAEAKIVTTSWDSGDFNGFVQENCYRYCQADFIVQPWTLIRPECLRVREKMERAGKTLEQRETKIRLGLATGDNNAFVIDDEMRLRLVKQDSNNRKLIKPVIRGQDIQRYCHEAPKYILLTKNDVNVRRDYPTVYKYLDGFGERFKKRGAKGAHWTNLRACAFFDDFKLEKIIWIELTDQGRFSYSSKEEYLLNSAYFLLPPKGFIGKFMLGLLNSTSIQFFMKQVAATSGMGTLRWINNYVKMFPIPDADYSDQEPIAKLADKILSIKANDREADTTALESQIDQLVYKLYGLTEEEIAIVEGRGKTAATKVEPAAKPSRRCSTRPATAADSPRAEDDEELE